MRLSRLASLALLASFAVAMSCLAAPRLQAQQPDQLYTATKQQLDVTKVLIAQQNSWNKGDLDGYLARFKDAPDTEAILAGPTLGLTAIRNAYHLNFPNKESMGALEQTEIQVRELGENFALATGKYHLMRTKKAGGEANGSFTEVLEKTAAGWQVIFSETT